MSLVPIPWQPFYYLRPETLALLDAASDKAGRRLKLYTGDPRGLLSAWRSWSQQNELYQAFLAGGNPASNPNTGPRYHMRGAAFDLVDQDAATQKICRSVGLIRDLNEPWHWNHPNWASMPVIKTNTTTSSGGISPLTEGTDMSDYRQIKTLGNPATFADTTGLVVTEGLSAAEAQLRRTGRDTVYIKQKLTESDKAWATRKASVIAYWKAEAAANVNAIKG